MSNGSKFSYDVFIDEPGYLIGIVSFKCSPAYSQTTPRDIFHYDRLDDFQPFLQNIGDQEVFIQELRSIGAFRENTWNGESVHPPYAYQLQDAEYKYSVNEIHGGLVKTLPTWFFVQNVDYACLVSEFLRLYPYQFDKFYNSLTGCSSESYYHFIISFVNKVTAISLMMYRPGIV